VYIGIIACLVGVAAAAAPASAQSVADFYKGKTVTLVISSGAGGGYDTLSRTVARYIGKKIPGEPNVVAQNMPGAGGIVATNYMFSIAPKDGTAIAGVQNNAPLEPLFGTKEAKYDATKFNWLGTPSVEVGLLAIWHGAGVRTLDDAKTRELKAGASGINSAPSFYARLLQELIGLKVKIIAGYPGQAEAFLAMERGELDFYGTTFLSALQSFKPDWIKDKKLDIVLQYGPQKSKQLPDVPFLADLITKPEQKQLLRAAEAPLALGRPFLIPPDVPVERVAALRKAFLDMLADPEFADEAKKKGLETDTPRSGQVLQEEVDAVYKTPPAIVEQLRRIAQGT
jgi:tripartite-type tricarboxylate transporter receptor subunit TctC